MKTFRSAGMRMLSLFCDGLSLIFNGLMEFTSFCAKKSYKKLQDMEEQENKNETGK